MKGWSLGFYNNNKPTDKINTIMTVAILSRLVKYSKLFHDYYIFGKVIKQCLFNSEQAKTVVRNIINKDGKNKKNAEYFMVHRDGDLAELAKEKGR